MPRHNPRVVAHRLDGTLYRGTTEDFRPGVETFTVVTAPEGESVEVVVAELKALFFVRTWTGKPDHIQSNTFDAGPKVGCRVWVVFSDGEELAGRAPAVNPEAAGFFLFPSDQRSNLERAWVVTGNTKSVLFGDEATEASDSCRPPRAGPVPRFTPDEWDEMLRLKDIATPSRWQKGVPRSRGSRPKAEAGEQSDERHESDIFRGEW